MKKQIVCVGESQLNRCKEALWKHGHVIVSGIDVLDTKPKTYAGVVIAVEENIGGQQREFRVTIDT